MRTLCGMATALPTELPLRLIELLRAQGVATLEGWTALGRRRRQIFGVTRSAVAQLDALAKAALRPKDQEPGRGGPKASAIGEAGQNRIDSAS
jgi:hypothetical protein